MENIDEKLIQIHNDLFEIHQDMLKMRKGISPAIILIGKDYELTPMLMRWSDGQQKEVMKYFIKKRILNEQIKGYVFVADARMTIADKDMDFSKAVVKEAVIQNLFTPNGNRMSMIIHKGYEIEKAEHLNPEDMTNYQSDWDLWNSPITEDKDIQDAYRKFKEENPDKFPDV
jgi:hypothetical protein